MPKRSGDAKPQKPPKDPLPDPAEIRRARELLGFTQEQLARRWGVNRSAVRAWETRRPWPWQRDAFNGIAAALGKPAPFPAHLQTKNSEKLHPG